MSVLIRSGIELGLGGRVYLAGPPREEPKALIAQPPADAGERFDYEGAAQIGTRKAWEVFLRTHAKGFYADLAREQIAKLIAAEAAVEAERQKGEQAAQPRTEYRRRKSRN